MGKLSDLIKRAGRTEPDPMGFGAAARQSHTTMLLVAIAGDRWPRAAAEAVDAGADALLLTGRLNDNDVKEAAGATKDRPCGLLAPDATAEQLERLREAGLDFAVIGPHAPAAAIVDDKLSLAFHLRDDLTDIQLRALESMPFEAIYVERDASPTTVMRLLDLRRIAGLVRKPLLLQVAPGTGQDDLVALRGAGVALIGVDMKERNAADALLRLRQVIDTLPRRKVRSEDRTRIALPHAAAAEADDEGGDDE